MSSSPATGVVTLVTEHEAVLESADFLKRHGFAISLVGVDCDGTVDVEALLESVSEDTAVVSVMIVNNETGVIQDIPRIARELEVAQPGALMHTDAVQAFACEDIDVSRLGVDLMSITAHKLGGPKGFGLLYVREGVALEAVLHGGGQELGRRSGTHDVAGAVGMAEAMELASGERAWFRDEIGRVRDLFEERLFAGIEGLVRNSPEVGRSPHHSNLRIPGVRNETLLMRLDRAGVAASAGSACQSGAATVSHVLEGMGLTAEEARESLRFSFGWTTTWAEAEEAADLVVDLVGRLR